MSQMKSPKSPDVAELREVLSYDSESGKFTWRVSRGTVAAGASAGHVKSNGYLVIQFKGRVFALHRLAWLLETGEWPEGDIDHVNGDRKDNRIANLRHVSRSVNLQNQRGPRRNSKSGLLGVFWRRDVNRWQATITVGGKGKYLGVFKDKALAYEAYLKAKRELHQGCTI